jgi:CMP-N,N'-diacetyllegionaminic acid synthase
MAGRPLVAWTLEAALGARCLDRIVVSTDDPAVAAVAADMGLPPPFRRPAALAGDEASVMDAIAHTLTQVGGDWDLVVLLQPTSPLRTSADVDAAVELCRSSGTPAVIGVCRPPKPFTFHVSMGPEGTLAPAPDGLDDVRLINGAVYVGRPEVVLEAGGFLVPGALAYEMPADRSWDVDTAEEFAACEAWLSSPDRRA